MRGITSPTLETYLDQIAGELLARLADGVVGIYLHGSAAMGSFVPTRSDVDVLVITSGSIASEAKTRLAAALSALPCPGLGLELSVVTSESARTPSDTPAFELHVDTRGNRVVDGRGAPGDVDLIAHFAMTRARGVTVFGPPATDVISPIDRSRLLRTLAEDLAWAIERGTGAYAVLNACRALRFARDGVLSSKVEGGDWAIEHGVGDPALITSALRRQSGADTGVDERRAASLAAWVRNELLNAATP